MPKIRTSPLVNCAACIVIVSTPAPPFTSSAKSADIELASSPNVLSLAKTDASILAIPDSLNSLPMVKL